MMSERACIVCFFIYGPFGGLRKGCLFMEENVKLIQPYFVIHTDHYYKAICAKYGISHFYMYTLQNPGDVAVVPDGCIDLVFEYGSDSMRARACGTVFEYHKAMFQYGYTYFGVRFLPGVCPVLLQTSPKELVSREADLTLLADCTELLGRMEEQHTFIDCVHTFLETYGRMFDLRNGHEKTCVQLLVDSSLHMIYQSGGRIKIHELEAQTGYSSRYINRAFNECTGYSPKTLCKIVQFQKLICHMNAMQSIQASGGNHFADMAVDFGYYDQPQLIRDFKKFTNVTPKTYEKIIVKAQYNRHLIERRLA